MTPSVLIAGIGNIFHCDDGFGVFVAQKLSALPIAGNVRVVDFGIRGYDLVLALLDGYDVTIFVDAVSRGNPPGTLYKIEPDLDDIPDVSESGVCENAHGLDPLRVLSMAKSLGASLGRIVVVGCEPATLEDDTGYIGLSEAVETAVEPAMEMIRSTVVEFLGDSNAPGRKVA